MAENSRCIHSGGRIEYQAILTELHYDRSKDTLLRVSNNNYLVVMALEEETTSYSEAIRSIALE